MKYLLLSAFSMLCSLPFFLKAGSNEPSANVVEQKDCSDSLIQHYKKTVTTQLDSAKLSIKKAESNNVLSKKTADVIESNYYISCCK